LTPFRCSPNSQECVSRNCTPTASPLAQAGRRRLQTCGSGCQQPFLAGNAVASYPVRIALSYSSNFSAYAVATTGYQITYGVCVAIGCNYRNVTSTYLTGNSQSSPYKTTFLYNIVFYNPPGSSNITGQPAALIAALPSTNVSAVGSIAWGLVSSQGGGMSTLTAVYPGSHYGTAAPPLPPLPPPQPPQPPPRPPSPPSPLMQYTCVCLNGFSGADCSIAPQPPSPSPSPPPMPSPPPSPSPSPARRLPHRRRVRRHARGSMG